MARIRAFIDSLRGHPGLREALCHHEVLPAQRAVHAPLGGDGLTAMAPVLARRGIGALYRHQARALELLGKGRDVVLSTPTASGKSLVYNLPALAGALEDPEARSLYLFPLRALEQDQHRRLEEDIAALGRGPDSVRVAIYDGDTPTARRKKLREDPPHILITTPDMLHMGILPHHESWKRFFAGLNLVVIDELHTYRGVFGSHVAQVLRRLERLARHHRAGHGAAPRFVATSATVANPGELAGELVGREFAVVSDDGAPRTERHVLLLNPTGSPYTAASRLFRLAVGQGLRTIAFTKARSVTELMYQWIVDAQPELRPRISAYRAGFLPEERREIETRLFEGDLLGVISTSALEMGIDVGHLDVCILVGYPGSQIATWQRGGRVGRTRDAVIALVAQPDALDQYLVQHPRAFFESKLEHAVLDSKNPDVLGGHLPCAAAELPLRADEPWLSEPATRAVVSHLEEQASLLRSESGREWFAARRRPHRDVDLRAAGSSWAIIDERSETNTQAETPAQNERTAKHRPSPAMETSAKSESAATETSAKSESAATVTSAKSESAAKRRASPANASEPSRKASAPRGRAQRGRSPREVQQDGGARPRRRGNRDGLVGSIGSGRVFAECHEGAIYLHRGRQYLVTRLDWEERRVSVRAVSAPYYTRALSEKETEILSRERARPVGNFRLVQGRVKVTTRITSYERRRVHGQDLIGTEKLELPPSHFETTALWLEIPDEIPDALRSAERHVMGGIHATEHAALALVPLFALCDRFDVAGISYVKHPQLGRAAIFLYDGHAGGVGLMASVFGRIEGLLEATHELIDGCDCEEGCPACVHSPKCGSGNRPIDKAAAVQVLDLLLARVPLPPPKEEAAVERVEARPPAAPPPRAAEPSAPEVLVFDLETQRSAEEVGGWHNTHLMRLALGVIWDARRARFETYREGDVDTLLARLQTADLVVGFNVRRFDYQVLRGYTDSDFDRIATYDMLDAVHARLGFRLSLAHLGTETLGRGKSGDGLQSLQWWKEGRFEEVEAYCRDDVALLRDLFEHARQHGHLLFRTRSGERVRLPLHVSLEELLEQSRAREGREARR